MGFPCIRCFCCGRTDLYLRGPAVRPIGRPFGLLQDHQAYLGTPPFFLLYRFQTLEALEYQISYILSLLRQLGLRVHLTRSHLAQSQTVEYLGVVLHLTLF